MKRFRLVGAMLLALFALSVVSSTALAAAPEFKPSSGVKITTKTVGKLTLELLSGTKVECSEASTGGEITGAKTISKIIITFEECKAGIFKCASPKAGGGLIITHEITGTLGYINSGAKPPVVGILFATTKAGDFFAEFDCAGGIVKNKVLGQVICPIEKVNTDTKEFTLKCEQEKGDQKPTKFEGGETEVLKTSVNGGAEEDSAEQATAKITPSVLSEIVA